jgi:DNA uptake protein ComE-like DNA-binding protein
MLRQLLTARGKCESSKSSILSPVRTPRLIPLAILGVTMTLACAQASGQVSFEQQLAHSRQLPSEPLDINTATAKQLNALPGFGPAYTRRVIAGRPYSAKNQIVTRGVVPQEAYERVSDLIVAHRVAK